MYTIKTKISFALFCALISMLLLEYTSKKATNDNPNTFNIKSTIVENIELFKDYYPSGTIKVAGQYSNKLKTGKWILYYENGEIQSIEHYKNGRRDGYHKMDYSGALFMEGSFKEDIKIGTWKSFFKESKQLKYLKHYDDKGVAIGEWKSYYDTGELASVENYVEGKANGKQIAYFKNGNIYTIGEKTNNRENGLWKYYYDDGNLLCEKQFKNGVEDGKYIEYFKNGTVRKIGNKATFKKQGLWKTYDEQGNLVDSIHN